MPDKNLSTRFGPTWRDGDKREFLKMERDMKSCNIKLLTTEPKHDAGLRMWGLHRYDPRRGTTIVASYYFSSMEIAEEAVKLVTNVADK
jgi:hypothetical protein